MASRRTAGAAAKKQAEAEPTQAVTPNEPQDAQTEPVQETPVEATRPDKVRVRITRNLDTGEQQVDEL